MNPVEKKPLPQQNDWNNFWRHQPGRTQAPPSWSKQRILMVLERHLPSPSGCVLDAGCGSGFFSAFFCRKDFSTLSLDYAPSALAMTRAVAGEKARLIKADLLKEPLAEHIAQPVDAIFSDGLFEHFSSEEQDIIMQNLISVLVSGGRMITCVPNRWSFWQVIRPLFMPGIMERPFVMKELRDLHERNGLTLIDGGGLNVWPFRFSPDRLAGEFLGMLLFVVAQKNP